MCVCARVCALVGVGGVVIEWVHGVRQVNGLVRTGEPRQQVG